ncbi:MAG TPA: hypothetical protein VJ501_07600 [Burkholderiaceae bacterium]|nr:hypothetical protein [Burkholderiaceae bacterium]
MNTPAIDILSFPPDESALEQMRAKALDNAKTPQHYGQVASFVGAGLMLAWVADVAAVLESSSTHSPALGVFSLVLAALIITAHLWGRHLRQRALQLRGRVERYFSPVRIEQAGVVLSLAQRDAAVSQYLRMVGRQRRALRQIESESLQRFAAENRLD